MEGPTINIEGFLKKKKPVYEQPALCTISCLFLSVTCYFVFKSRSMRRVAASLTAVASTVNTTSPALARTIPITVPERVRAGAPLHPDIFCFICVKDSTGSLSYHICSSPKYIRLSSKEKSLLVHWTQTMRFLRFGIASWLNPYPRLVI